MSVVGAQKRVRAIRSRGQAIGLLLTGCFVAVGFAVEALRPSSDEVDPIVRIGFAVLGVLFGGFIILRMARSGVYVRETGIRVLNPFQTRTLEWGSWIDSHSGRGGRFHGWRMPSSEMAELNTFGGSKPPIRPSGPGTPRRVDSLTR
jgi:hypothetical protein